MWHEDFLFRESVVISGEGPRGLPSGSERFSILAGQAGHLPLVTGRLRLLLLAVDGRCLFHSVCGNLEPQSVKFDEVLTVVQKAVPWCPRKNVILQLEVSYQNQGERVPRVKVYEWHLVVAWHGDFGEQVAVLHSPGNH